jgi:small subunit ribosomal protein S2
VNHEKIAVAEGERCAIPTVGLVDTNSDPTHVAYPIPGNDDAVKSIRIIVDTILEAIQAGLGQRDSRRASKVADLKAVTAEVAAAAEAATTATKGETPVAVDAIVGEDEVETEAVVAKKPLRKKIAAPKTEE